MKPELQKRPALQIAIFQPQGFGCLMLISVHSGGRCCPARRGEWWSRLTINLSTHLKRDQEALEVGGADETEAA